MISFSFLAWLRKNNALIVRITQITSNLLQKNYNYICNCDPVKLDQLILTLIYIMTLNTIHKIENNARFVVHNIPIRNYNR